MHMRSQGFTLGYSLILPAGGVNGDSVTDFFTRAALACLKT